MHIPVRGSDNLSSPQSFSQSRLEILVATDIPQDYLLALGYRSSVGFTEHSRLICGSNAVPSAICFDFIHQKVGFRVKIHIHFCLFSKSFVQIYSP